MKMKTFDATVPVIHLLDVNVLIALSWPQHVHHALAHQWFDRIGRRAWATCPLTQLAFVRISSNPKIVADAVRPPAALAVLAQMVAQPNHHFWADDLPLNELATMTSMAFVGHRQVTDAYLLELARHRGGVLATLDAGLVALLPPEDRARHVALLSAARNET